jgi:hypothetical protein
MSLFDSDDIRILRGEPAQMVVKKEVADVKPKKIVYKEPDLDKLIVMDRKVQLDHEKYQDFTIENYPYSLNFYDFEVFMCDWMVVIVNPIENIKEVIVNDRKALKRYYRHHKEELWVGYNSRNYDTYILKSILLDMNPKKVNDKIIMLGMKGWQISDEFKDIQLLDFDIAPAMQGLKQLEGFMGNNIKETSVPFDLDRELTRHEVVETIKYCGHDVEQLIEVFKIRKTEYDAQIDMINTFHLDIAKVRATKAQLSAKVIGCEKKEHDDEFDLQIVPILKLKKYKLVRDWFENPRNHDYKNSLEIEVCGVPHVFGWGGLHGCPEEPLHIKGRLFHVDVTSYYPSIMIVYDFLTRNCENKKKFKEIYDKRVELKKAGKKKEQAPYKIILNSTYGICKDKNSSAYDPRQANNVCVNGQLMLLDLLEHLEGYADIIQSNTDGIILQVADNDDAEKKMREICQEWMDRTKMGLGFDEISEIWQKDVNNYIMRFTNGKLERKGAYVKELSELDNDLPIVNKAIVDYLTKGVLPEDTIAECNELKQFQKIVKISSNYCMGWHNGHYLTDRTFRVFASKDKSDTYIGKCKTEGATIEKFANTCDNVFIFNDEVNGVEIPEKLDKTWYINLAKKRIADFGIDLNTNSLF